MNIRLQDIEFSYDKTPVLQNISTEIRKGEFVALAGPNGSGKSTLIKCLNGILKVDKGAIWLNEQSLDSFRAGQLARKMAYVPQTEQKAIPMSVFDAVLIGRKPYIRWKPATSDMNVTAGILKKLKLESQALREINKLSGGQQQRVYIARALAQEPEVLLLDEPTANLDLKHQVEVLEILHNLTKQGITVIMAMHDINMASIYCSRILMLKEGRLFADGGREVFTSENLEKLYDIKVQAVSENGSIFIIPNRSESH